MESCSRIGDAKKPKKKTNNKKNNFPTLWHISKRTRPVEGVFPFLPSPTFTCVTGVHAIFSGTERAQAKIMNKDV